MDDVTITFTYTQTQTHTSIYTHTSIHTHTSRHKHTHTSIHTHIDTTHTQDKNTHIKKYTQHFNTVDSGTGGYGAGEKKKTHDTTHLSSSLNFQLIREQHSQTSVFARL